MNSQRILEYSASGSRKHSPAMRRDFRKIGFFFLLLFLAYLFFFNYSAAIYRRLPIIQSAAARHGIDLKLEKLNLISPTALEIEGLDLTFNQDTQPIVLQIDHGKFETELLPLLLLEANLKSQLKAYEGSLFLALTSSIISRQATFSFTAQDLDLLKHPQAFAAGFSGKLKSSGEFKLVGSQFAGYQASEGDFSLEITNGHYNGGHTLFRSIKSPEIRDITISLFAKQFPQRIGINSLDIFSSLGRASGSGFVHLNTRNIVERGRVELNARLTPQGAELFGGYFALGAGQPLENPGRNWKILIVKERNSDWSFQVRPQA